MKAGLILLDELNRQSTFPLLSTEEGTLIVPSTGDFIEKDNKVYRVSGVYWNWNEQSISVVAEISQ